MHGRLAHARLDSQWRYSTYCLMETQQLHLISGQTPASQQLIADPMLTTLTLCCLLEVERCKKPQYPGLLCAEGLVVGCHTKDEREAGSCHSSI